jgi:hypothetical protein
MMGRMRVTAPRLWMRPAAELALLVAFGLFTAMLGPYDLNNFLGGRRWAYWLVGIVGGGLIGIAIDEAVRRRTSKLGVRVATTSVLMTPLVCLLVLADGRLMAGPAMLRPQMPDFLWQVFIICLAVMGVRALVWRTPAVRVETRTVIAPPLPEAEATFRRRLSAKRRTARLIAVEADDHYLRVHTDAGSELVTARMSDAMNELAAAHGFRVHRSWWVAADAVEAVQWRKGVGEVRLVGGLVTPVSRSYGPALKAAGWF